jgi:hypothetical protein
MFRVTTSARAIATLLELDEMERQPLPGVEKHAPALTEKRVIERVLALASSRNYRSAAPHAWALQKMVEVFSKVAPQVVREREFHEDELLRFCRDLADDLDVIRAKALRPARLYEKVKDRGSRMVLIPRISFDGGELVVTHRYRPADLEAAVGYAMALLLDTNRSYGAKLCRCDLSTCRRFFLAPPSMPKKGGKPLTTACRPAHKRLADNEKSIARVRRWRIQRH